MEEILEERRNSPRSEFARIPLYLQLELPEALRVDRPFRLEGRNISLGGMKLLTNHKLQLFQSLKLELFSKTDPKRAPLSLTAKVVRVEEIDTGEEEKSFGVALQFQTGAESLSAFLPTQESLTKK